MWKIVKILLICRENLQTKMTFFDKNKRAHPTFVCMTSILVITEVHRYMYLIQKANMSRVQRSLLLLRDAFSERCLMCCVSFCFAIWFVVKKKNLVFCAIWFVVFSWCLLFEVLFSAFLIWFAMFEVLFCFAVWFVIWFF